MKARVLLGLAMILIWLPGIAASAADYPDRPVKIVVPFPAGGAVDVIARMTAQKLSDRLGGQFYVENLPGAGGDIGTAAVAAAPADGYTMLFVAPDFVISPLVKAKRAYDPLKSFAPVSLVASAQEIVTINPSVTANTILELIALLTANPERFSFATPGYGTLTDLEAIRLFDLHYGAHVLHVPFQGMAPALNSTLGGHTNILFAPVALVAPDVKAGTLRALAVEGTVRSPILPDVPTLREAGVPDHESEFATGLLVPAGTSQALIDTLRQQIADIVILPDAKARLSTLGFDPIASTPEMFTKWIQAETQKWAGVVRQAGVKVQ